MVADGRPPAWAQVASSKVTTSCIGHEAGGFAACSRWSRSAAMTPPETHAKVRPRIPAGMPAPREQPGWCITGCGGTWGSVSGGIAIPITGYLLRNPRFRTRRPIRWVLGGARCHSRTFQCQGSSRRPGLWVNTQSRGAQRDATTQLCPFHPLVASPWICQRSGRTHGHARASKCWRSAFDLIAFPGLEAPNLAAKTSHRTLGLPHVQHGPLNQGNLNPSIPRGEEPRNTRNTRNVGCLCVELRVCGIKVLVQPERFPLQPERFPPPVSAGGTCTQSQPIEMHMGRED